MRVKKFLFGFFIFWTTGISGILMAEPMPNRLIHEKSPYLLQHADNPVDWYPWGEEAFEKSRRENKPIFLSIGYSTCHWCHVMEHESFENPAIAALLNEHFVSIKVDREERPDIDHVYMEAVTAMTGSGGWPISLFLTPDLKPFYGGTYFPPDDRWGRAGFASVLKSIAEKWRADKKQIANSSTRLTLALLAQSQKPAGEKQTLDESILKKAFGELASRFDPENGGFGSAPKFPQAHAILFLLRYWKRTGNPAALQMAEKTLSEMARGGIYDHAGGGFHRYSTDQNWFLPHFEKMLYDQAVLAEAYLEAYQANGNKFFADVAREIFDYVLSQMTSAKGAFYSAEDADSVPPEIPNSSEKREGAFYLWRASEIKEILGPEAAALFNFHYGVEEAGNMTGGSGGEFDGKNILYARRTPAETSGKFKKSEDEVRQLLSDAKEKLRQARAKRPRPHLDDKILVDWNGLMISSLASSSRILKEPRYAEAAKKAADFLITRLKTKEGRLLHRWWEGEAAVPAFLDDYAFFAHGLIDLYQATFELRYLKEAIELVGEMNRLFWDESQGGYFFTARGSERLILQTKQAHDDAVSSGNSAAALSLVRLARFTTKPEYDERAAQMFDAFSPELSQYPSAFCSMLAAFDFALGPSIEIVIAGDRASEEVKTMNDEIDSIYLPNKIVALNTGDREETKRLEQISPFISRQTPLDGKPTAYVCKNFMCKFPTTNLEKFKQLLRE